MADPKQAPEGARPVFDKKQHRKNFDLHVQLIEFQDGVGKAEAMAKAYWEGMSGLPRRAGKTVAAA